MPVATASREAYGRMRTVKPKEHPVYKFLKSAGAGSAGYNNRQIALIMKRPINTITPRVFELRAAGVVVLAGKRKDTYSGVEVSHWRIATEAEEAAFKAFTSPPTIEDPESIPRTWLHLADIPEGVTVRETGEATWLWERLPHGLFRSSASNGASWSGEFQLTHGEAFYGPVKEVK